MPGHRNKTGRKIHGKIVYGPFCGPEMSFPADTQKRAKSAIQRASQLRRGQAKRRIQRCACSVLVEKFGKVTPVCRRLGFGK